MTELNVLSLFDGISCGRLALQRAGIPVNYYFASEIDNYAIKVTQKNFPDTIQIGDVTKVDWKPFERKIDLLIGGSPCQGFSFAGKQLNFKDPRSILFFKFVEALETIKPRFFLFENTMMKKEWSDIITEKLGVKPVKINSSSLSAQSRRRLYWFNWDAPELVANDIQLKDIIEDGYVDREKSLCLRSRYAQCKGTQSYLCREYFGKSKDQLVFLSQGHYNKVYNMWKENNRFVTADKFCRVLSCIECERLQTLPDNYTEGLVADRRKELIGNGWTVDVIAHILKGINNA